MTLPVRVCWCIDVIDVPTARPAICQPLAVGGIPGAWLGARRSFQL